MPNFKHEAIILKRINLGEADRIVTAFSKHGGKIKFVAKGVRRTKSKLAGSLELFCKCDLQISTGKSLDILTSAQIINNYLGLSPQLVEVKFASLVAEIVDKLIPENFANPKIYYLINEIFEQIKKVNIETLKVYFLSQFFNFSGISPETNYCVKCGEKPKERIYFSNEAGGLLDENCSLYYTDSKEVDVNTIKIIRYATEHSFSSFLKLKVIEKDIVEANIFLTEYLKYSSGKTYKSETI